jgi:hypothetical protein
VRPQRLRPARARRGCPRARVRRAAPRVRPLAGTSPPVPRTPRTMFGCRPRGRAEGCAGCAAGGRAHAAGVRGAAFARALARGAGVGVGRQYVRAARAGARGRVSTRRWGPVHPCPRRLIVLVKHLRRGPLSGSGPFGEGTRKLSCLLRPLLWPQASQFAAAPAVFAMPRRVEQCILDAADAPGEVSELPPVKPPLHSLLPLHFIFCPSTLSFRDGCRRMHTSDLCGGDNGRSVCLCVCVCLCVSLAAASPSPAGPQVACIAAGSDHSLLVTDAGDLLACGANSGGQLGLRGTNRTHIPPPPRTNRTRRVPHPVLIGHAASLTPY